MLSGPRTLIGALDEPLDQSEQPMHRRQRLMSRLVRLRDIELIMPVAGQRRRVRTPRIRGHGRSRSNIGRDELAQARCRRILDHGQAGSTPPGLGDLNRPSHQRLTQGTPASNSGPGTTEERLIDLDATTERSAAGRSHHLPQLRQHRPRCLIRPDRQHPVDMRGRDSGLVDHHQPGRLKPRSQWDS
jgi:hypothetical protein